MVVPPTVSPMIDKVALRAQVRAARRAFVATLGARERAAFERALAQLVAPLLHGAVASYSAMASEIDPRFITVPGTLLFPRVTTPLPLAGGAGGGGGESVVENGFAATIPPPPAPPASGRGERLRFFETTMSELSPGYAKIPEPPDGAPEATPDVILVPLVAVDCAGNRIGQGAGHYDRTLAALRPTRPIVTIGLAWEVQIVEKIPVDPWDIPLDYVATPYRLVDCRTRR